MDYKKLGAIAVAVGTLVTYTFNSYTSQDGLIKQGVDRLKAVAKQYKDDLATLQSQYDGLVSDLNNAESQIAQAKIKLQAIYQKITGEAWDEATQGDILEFDFNTLVKDGEQFENNVDGNAIADILGIELEEGEVVTTQMIIAEITNLKNQIADLEGQITTLNQTITQLQTDIAAYESEQDSLVEEINSLKAKLDSANEIIRIAHNEEQDQLDYINDALVEFGEEAVGTPADKIPAPEVEEGEQEEPEQGEEPEAGTQGTEKQEAYNNLSDNAKTLADMGYSNGDLTYRSDIASYVCASATVGEKYESLKGTMMVFNSNVNTYLVNGITQADVEALNNWANM